jgi:hypothetical protein
MTGSNIIGTIVVLLFLLACIYFNNSIATRRLNSKSNKFNHKKTGAIFQNDRSTSNKLRPSNKVLLAPPPPTTTTTTTPTPSTTTTTQAPTLLPSTPNILVTVATALGRRWITILSLLSITNALTQMVHDGYNVSLLVSFVGYPFDKGIQNILASTTFQFPLITEHVNVSHGQGGFVRSREHLVDYFLLNSKFSHWLHFDDDMIVGHDNSLSRAVNEYTTNTEIDKGFGVNVGGGLLVLFLNSWSRTTIPLIKYGPLYTIKYAGAPAFILNRQTLETIGGNPYRSCRLHRKKGCPDGEAANDWFWKKLKKHKMSLLSNTQYPYSVQHLANSQSLIFGKQKSWEHLWATNRNIKYKGQIVKVLPYILEEVRRAVSPIIGENIKNKLHSKLGHSNALVEYVFKMNGNVGDVKFPLDQIDELKEDLE